VAVNKEDIRNLVRLFEQSDWQEMRLEVEGLKLAVSKRGPMEARGPVPSAGAPPSAAPVAAAGPVPAAAPAPAPVAEAPGAGPAALAAGQVHIKAPNLGVFWKQPKPGAPPYVRDGEAIEPDTTVCLIEVMKLFTPVKAGISGKIVRCLVEDGEMVEHDTPLYVVQQ